MNELISSRFTFVTKRLFPALWFGFLLFFVVTSVTHDESPLDLAFIAAPLFMAVVGFFLFKVLLWDLADAVYDQGTHLLVRRGGVEDRISIDNIMNVSFTLFMNPPRVTLRLVRPSAFGTYVSFSPKSAPLRLSFSQKNPVVEHLIERAYASRAKRAG